MNRARLGLGPDGHLARELHHSTVVVWHRLLGRPCAQECGDQSFLEIGLNVHGNVHRHCLTIDGDTTVLILGAISGLMRCSPLSQEHQACMELEAWRHHRLPIRGRRRMLRKAFLPL